MCFKQISGRSWPRDPFKRVGPEKWCRTHPKLAQETNSKAASSPFSVLLGTYLKAVWQETFGPVFSGLSTEIDPRDPPRSPGPAPHINSNEKSAPQTKSRAKWWREKSPARPPSGTQDTVVGGLPYKFTLR